MGRLYIVPEWTNAAEDHQSWVDQGDTWNGQQVGNRNQKSIGVHIVRDGDHWKANTSAYSDEAIAARKAKPKAQRSIRERILPQEVRLNNLERDMRDLDRAYADGEVSGREYAELSAVLEKKYARTFELLSKQLGWDEEPEDEPEQQPATHYDDWTIPNDELDKAWKREKLSKQYGSIKTNNELFDSLRVDNSFRVLYYRFQKGKQKLAWLTDKLKELRV